MASQDVTRLLGAWSRGDGDALDELIPLVYERLRMLAASAFANESPGHTLQPTALVHEAFDRLVRVEVRWQDRAHFYALSARMMRRILVDHAKSRNAEKRGSGALHITFNDSLAGSHNPIEADVLALESVLDQLQEIDDRKARVIKMHYFAGLTYRELAELTGLAESTVHLEIRTARAWLMSRLKPEGT